MGLFGGLFGSSTSAPSPDDGMTFNDRAMRALALLNGDVSTAAQFSAMAQKRQLQQQQVLARQQGIERLDRLGAFGGQGPSVQVQAPDGSMQGGGPVAPPQMPNFRDLSPVLGRMAAQGVDTTDLSSIFEKAQPNLQVSNGVAYDTRDAGNTGKRIGVNLTNINGFMKDPNDPANANAFVPEAPAKGVQPYQAPGGGIGWVMAPGAVDAIAASEGAKAGAEAKAKAPYEFHNASPSDNVWWGGGDAAAQPPASPGAAPAVAAGPVGQRIAAAARASNATHSELGFLQTTAQLESAGNPNAQNGRSTGVFQFHPETYATAGGTGDIHDVGSQTTAALNLARQNSQALQQRLGRAPTPAEVYIAHQQGAGGASALLTAPPEVNAIAALLGAGVSPRIARLSILNNGGKEDMTAGQFTDMWRQRYEKASGGGAPAGQSQPPAGGPRLLQVGQPEQDAAPLDDKTVQYLAERYVAAGGGANALPPMGMGKAGSANRDKILNKAAEIEQQTGATGNDAVLRMHTIKAASGSLNAISKVRSQVEASESTVEKNAQFMLSLAPKGGGPTGSPLLNAPIQLWRNKMAGSPQVSSFNNAIGTVADEYAKVMTTNTGSGGAGTSDSARKEAYDRLSKLATFGQLQSNIAAMQTEMRNRTESLRSKEQELQDTIKNGGVAPKPKPAQAVPAGFKILSVR